MKHLLIYCLCLSSFVALTTAAEKPNIIVIYTDDHGFADLGIEPIAMEAVLEDYLWPYRPSGQYSEIKETAANLR